MNSMDTHVIENKSICPLVSQYIDRADDLLNNAIHVKKEGHPFWPSSRKRQLEQLTVLEQTKTKLNELQTAIQGCQKDPNNTDKLKIQLNNYFLYLANSIPIEPEQVESWTETINVLKQLIRIFISTVVAAQFNLFHVEAEQWSSICKERNILIPYVQFNVIGLINNVEQYNADVVNIYLKRLGSIDWNKNFEPVFTKKAIRDRLFKIANEFVSHAGSMDNLKAYLSKQLKSDEAVNNVKNMFQIYLDGIKRKYEILRITYPEFTYDNIAHPARNDVEETEKRMVFMDQFIAELK